MRLSALILNLLMLLMILTPCRDHKALASSRSSQQIHAAIPGSNQADDDCSPLCTCACCASVSPSIFTPVVDDLVPAPINKKFASYITPDYQTDRSAVWQPPRLA